MISNIRESIQNFLLSKPTKKATEGEVYGFDVYERLLEYTTSLSDQSYVDSRSYYAIYKHKELMKMRIEYLLENNYIRISCLYDECLLLEKEASIILNLVIKYSLTKQQNILPIIIKKLKTMIDLEKETLIKLIQNLE